jgi:hypothetical protein
MKIAAFRLPSNGVIMLHHYGLHHAVPARVWAFGLVDGTGPPTWHVLLDSVTWHCQGLGDAACSSAGVLILVLLSPAGDCKKEDTE